MATCSSRTWDADFKEMYCTEGVALVTGGWNTNNAGFSVEVYGPDMGMMIHKEQFYKYGHKVSYIDDFLVICGGFSQDKKCYKMTNLGVNKTGVSNLSHILQLSI